MGQRKTANACVPSERFPNGGGELTWSDADDSITIGGIFRVSHPRDDAARASA